MLGFVQKTQISNQIPPKHGPSRCRDRLGGFQKQGESLLGQQEVKKGLIIVVSLEEWKMCNHSSEGGKHCKVLVKLLGPSKV